MRIDLPRTPFYFVSIFAALWIAQIFLVTMYFYRTQELDYYPPEADSIGIPILGNAMIVVGLAFPLAILLVKVWKHYPERCDFFIWRSDRPIASLLISVFCLSVCILMAGSFVEKIRIELPFNAFADLCWLYIWATGRALWLKALKPRLIPPPLPAG